MSVEIDPDRSEQHWLWRCRLSEFLVRIFLIQILPEVLKHYRFQIGPRENLPYTVIISFYVRFCATIVWWGFFFLATPLGIGESVDRSLNTTASPIELKGHSIRYGRSPFCGELCR
jgi:hypothetical protein